MVDALFPAVRTGVLSATMLQPEHWWFMTELARNLEIMPSSLQCELESLVSAGILLRRQDERHTYFKANTDSPLFLDLKGMLEKAAGIVPAVQAALQPWRRAISICSTLWLCSTRRRILCQRCANLKKPSAAGSMQLFSLPKSFIERGRPRTIS